MYRFRYNASRTHVSHVSTIRVPPFPLQFAFCLYSKYEHIGIDRQHLFKFVEYLIEHLTIELHLCQWSTTLNEATERNVDVI